MHQSAEHQQQKQEHYQQYTGAGMRSLRYAPGRVIIDIQM
jgi:hypothetical protein